MVTKDLSKLAPGLYRIYWKEDDRTSLASIGILHDGTRWLAPCNWSSQEAGGIARSDYWDQIEQVELIVEDTGNS